MEYKVNELAKLSGVSTRTLRYYHQMDLLLPKRVDPNGYRIYGQVQVDRLQQILFYRELGISLDEIKTILAAPNFDKEESLEHHLSTLLDKKEQLDVLIRNVTKTICSMKEGTVMADTEKFEGFKQTVINENAKKYGNEVIETYGKEAFDASNEKVADMTAQQWEKQQTLSADICRLLEAAMKKNDPACKEAQEAADLHRQWLCLFWKDGTYSKQAHSCLAEGYVADPRFTDFYEEKLGKGGAAFLRDAIVLYTK